VCGARAAQAALLRVRRRLCYQTGGPICPHKLWDVFELLLTHVNALELDFALDLLIHLARDADAAWLSGPFKPRGDVDPIAINALLVEDHIPLVDPNPELHTPLWCDSGIPFGHCFLDSDSTFDRVQHAGEFGHDPIASGINDPATVAGDHGENDTLVAFEVTDGCDLIRTHQGAVTRDISCDNRRKAAAHDRLLLLGTIQY